MLGEEEEGPGSDFKSLSEKAMALVWIELMELIDRIDLMIAYLYWDIGGFVLLVVYEIGNAANWMISTVASTVR